MFSSALGQPARSSASGWRGRPVIDTDYLTRFAQAHEAAGFDRVLIAHRPGFVAPPDGGRLPLSEFFQFILELANPNSRSASYAGL